MAKRMIALLAAAVLLAGCGGGSKITDALLTLHTGAAWVYKVAGTVTLSAGSGGGTQTLQDASTLTMSVPAGTVTDTESGQPVNSLDRKFDLLLLDGRHVQGNMRLYWTQDTHGINCHGFNFSPGTTLDTTKDRFVKSTATPPLKFLYLPDPASDGITLQYSKPVNPASTGTSYSVALGNGRQQVTVPAGTFSAKAMALSEKFVSTTTGDFNLSSAGFVPDKGVVSAAIVATLPDGSTLNGTILLTSLTL